MNTEELYQLLNKHLSKFIIGIPRHPSMIEVLKLLFPPKEAQVALKLPMFDTKLSKLTELYPETENLEEILDSMVEHGTVFVNRKPGSEKVYRLLTATGGWMETPFWGGKDDELARKLAPFYKNMYTQEYSDVMAQGPPVVRVIPVSESLDDNSEVLPYDHLVPKIEATSFRAVAHCPCRHSANLRGEGCDHTVENCLHFGVFARYMVNQGMAKEITFEETVKILGEAREEGLVHVSNNMDGHLESICNCCTCGDCYWLVTYKKLNRGVMLRSNYMAQVSEDDCILCGICEERCPMDAISTEDSDSAVVDTDKCIGCGACTPSCDVEAIKLVQREEIVTPPNLEQWATERFEANQ